MDDRKFDNPSEAKDWIQMIESDKAKSRETDLYPKLNDWIKRASPKEILEIGAGQGICSAHIDLTGRKYTGLEPSPLLLERAKELYPQTAKSFVLGNIYQMPFSEGSFDAAFSVSVWHLLHDLHRASAELSRVLKKGGAFLIVSANPDAYPLWTASYTETHRDGHRLEGKTIRPDGTVLSDTLYLHSMDEILSALGSADLVESRIETFRPRPGAPDQYLLIEGHTRKLF